MFVLRDMSERPFPIAACCKEIVSSHEVSQGFRRSENILRRSWRHIFQLSLRWHLQLVAPEVLLICLVRGNCLWAHSS